MTPANMLAKTSGRERIVKSDVEAPPPPTHTHTDTHTHPASHSTHPSACGRRSAACCVERERNVALLLRWFVLEQEVNSLFFDAKASAKLLQEQADKYLM